jgi:hypothetical protein
MLEIEIPKQAFVGLVQAFLNEGYTLYLAVEDLAVKKEFGCECGAPVVAWSPDDRHIILQLEAGTESIPCKIKCEKCGKENVRHWHKSAGPVLFRSR